MSQRKVLFQRIVSPDGRSVATARSEVITSDPNSTVSHQSVTVTVSTSGTVHSASSCASSASTSSPASS